MQSKATGYIYFVVVFCCSFPQDEKKKKFIREKLQRVLPLILSRRLRKMKTLTHRKQLQFFQYFFSRFMKTTQEILFWGSKYLCLIFESLCKNLFFILKMKIFAGIWDKVFWRIIKSNHVVPKMHWSYNQPQFNVEKCIKKILP